MRQPIVNKTDTAHTEIRYPASLAWLGLGAVYLGFLTVGFVFHFLPPILPVVIADLGISHGQAGLLVSLFALPGILLSLPGGWLVDRYGERLVGSVGVILMGAGTLLLGLAPSFSLILLARVLSGAGAMGGVVALQRLVIRLFAGRRLGLPVGISGSAIPVGIVVVLNVAGPIAETSGWRVVAQRVGGVAVVVGLVFMVAIWLITRGAALGREQKQDDVPLADRGRLFRPLWIAGAVWFCANGAMTAFMTFAPDHFQGLGFDVSARGLFTSIPMWTSAALGMVTGWLTDRHGGRPAFMIVGMTMMGASLLLLPAAVVPPSLIGLVLGLSLAAVVTPTITLPGVLLPTTHTGRGYGILATCANLGIVIVPPLAGWMRDLSGGYRWPFVIMGVVAFGGVAAADILRRGRFLPGFSRQILVVLLLLPVVGCGRQDRYEVVSPGQEIAGEMTMGHLHDVTMFLGDDIAFGVADLWSATDFVVGGGLGRLIRVQGDVYTSLRFPVREVPVGVICQPGGDLLVATTSGGFWQWSGGSWQQWPSLPTDRVIFLTVDHLGRPLARAQYTPASLYRFENGVWEAVDLAGHSAIWSVWAHPGQGTWLATASRRIVQLTPTGVAWGDSLPFRDGFGGSYLAGNGADQLAYSSGHSDVWLRQSDAWTYHDPGQNLWVTGLFWRDDRLYATKSGGDLIIWENGLWQTVLDDAFDEQVHKVIESVGGHLILQNSGAGFLFDGTTVSPVSHGVARVRGLAEHQGRLVCYLNDGSLFQAEDIAAGVWRFKGQTAVRPEHYQDNLLLNDDRGRLIAWTDNGLEEWDGNGFVPLVASRGFRFVARMPDGEILVAEYSRVGSLRDGQFAWLYEADVGLSGVAGLWRRSPTVVDVLQDKGMYRLESAAEPRLLWTWAGWHPEALIPISAERALVLGDHNVREMIADEVVDVTPYILQLDEAVPITLTDVHELPDRRLLAWSDEYPGVLLRDAAGWHVINPVGGSMSWFEHDWRWSQLVPTGQNGLFVFGPAFLVRIDMEGVAR